MSRLHQERDTQKETSYRIYKAMLMLIYKIAIPYRIVCYNNLVTESSFLSDALFIWWKYFRILTIMFRTRFLFSPIQCNSEDISWGLPYCHPLLQESRIILETILYNNFDQVSVISQSDSSVICDIYRFVRLQILINNTLFLEFTLI